MSQNGEQLDNGFESQESGFDSLVQRVLPLADPGRSHISKLSAKTSGEGFDQLTYKHETPPLDLIVDGYSTRVGINIYYEELLYPVDAEDRGGTAIGLPDCKEVQINFVGQFRKGEGLGMEGRLERYGRNDLNDESKSSRLQTMLGLYEVAAGSLSPEEAEASGFGEAAIRFLSGS